MHKIEGKISKALYLKLPEGIKHLNIIGLFSKGIYLDSDKFTIMFHNSLYGLIPFGIAINNFEEIIKDINEDSKVEINKEYLKIDDIYIKLNVEDYVLNDKNKLNDDLFIKIAKEKLKKTTNGTFKNIIDDDFEENIYSIRLKEGLKDKDLSQIVGLGPGLTPSGDDFLLGYLMEMISEDKDINDLKERLKEIIYMNTNHISCLYYDAILNNERFSLFDEVLYAKDIKTLNIAIDKLFMVGSNSGVDILCGIIYAKMKKETL